MKLSKDEARDVIWDDHEDWREIESNVIDNNRWSIVHKGVFKHTPTNKYYSVNWRTGATEMQDERPFEYEDEIEFVEVEQVEVVVKQWKPKCGA